MTKINEFNAEVVNNVNSAGIDKDCEKVRR